MFEAFLENDTLSIKVIILRNDLLVYFFKLKECLLIPMLPTVTMSSIVWYCMKVYHTFTQCMAFASTCIQFSSLFLQQLSSVHLRQI